MKTWKAITLAAGGLVLLMTGVVQANLVALSVLGFVMMCIGLGSLLLRRFRGAMSAGHGAPAGGPGAMTAALVRWARANPRLAALLAVPVVVISLVAATHDGPADKGREYGQELASNFVKGGRAANAYACTQQAIVTFGNDSGKARAFESACADAYDNGIAAYR